MNHTVKQTPLLHHYLTALLLKIGLAEGTYDHIFNTVSDYTLLDYCRCGDPCCSTVYLHTPINKDGAFANPYKTAWVIINFYPDGNMEIENIADNEGYSFPFKQEVIDILSGKPINYTDKYARETIETFMSTLTPSECAELVI